MPAPKHEFVLHLDLNVISREDFPATDAPSDGGLSGSQVREALSVFARQPNLSAIEVAGYNPELDPDGEAARRLIELLVAALATRLEADSVAPVVGAAPASAVSEATPSRRSLRQVPEDGPQGTGDEA